MGLLSGPAGAGFAAAAAVRRSWDVDLADARCGGALGDVERQQPERVCLGRGLHRPPDRVLARAARGERRRRRSGLSWPLNEAKTTPHSCGSWRWWSTYWGMRPASAPRRTRRHRGDTLISRSATPDLCSLRTRQMAQCRAPRRAHRGARSARPRSLRRSTAGRLGGAGGRRRARNRQDAAARRARRSRRRARASRPLRIRLGARARPALRGLRGRARRIPPGPRAAPPRRAGRRRRGRARERLPVALRGSRRNGSGLSTRALPQPPRRPRAPRAADGDEAARARAGRRPLGGLGLRRPDRRAAPAATRCGRPHRHGHAAAAGARAPLAGARAGPARRRPSSESSSAL